MESGGWWRVCCSCFSAGAAGAPTRTTWTWRQQAGSGANTGRLQGVPFSRLCSTKDRPASGGGRVRKLAGDAAALQSRCGVQWRELICYVHSAWCRIRGGACVLLLCTPPSRRRHPPPVRAEGVADLPARKVRYAAPATTQTQRCTWTKTEYTTGHSGKAVQQVRPWCW